MKKIIYILFLLILAIPGEAQITFQKTYDVATSNNYGSSLLQTVDGGYVVAAFDVLHGAGPSEDVYLMKTDDHGSIIWTKTFGGTKGENGFHIKHTMDDGFIISGYTESFGAGKEDIYLIKTRSDGDTMWTKAYGGTTYEQALRVEASSDGGYILTGYTTVGITGDDMFLVKTNSSGQLLWSKKFGSTYFDYGYSVQEISNGDIILAGSYGGDAALIKTNSLGVVQWAKNYGNSGFMQGYSVQQTSDGGFIFLGDNYGSGGNLFLIKTDLNGSIQWAKDYGGTNQENASSVQQTSDGGYIIVGNVYNNPYDVLVIKTDSLGDTLWTKAYGDTHYDVAWGDAIRQTFDGGFVISCGLSIGNSRLALIKTDSLGNSWCNESSTQTMVSVFTPVVTTPIVLSSAWNITENNTGTIVGSGGLATTLCIQVGMDNNSPVESTMDIFPNPASDILYINHTSKSDQARFEIMDVTGRKIASFKQNNINVSKLPSGVYLLKVTEGDLQFSKRFVKL